MDHDSYSDSYIRGILNSVKSIAMVGASERESRPSYFAFKYLLERGYTMIPVNPGKAGETILGRRVYARLADVPEPIDMVDIFRNSRFAPAVVEEALALKPRPQVIWMQLGVRNEEAAALAGQELLGRTAYATLADIPEPVDMVDIFRAPQYAVAIVEQALALQPRPQVIWMQLGIRNDEAAKLAEANGLKVVMNRCPKIEYGRLSSEIAWMGVNTRTISAKKAKLFGGGIQRMALNRVTLAGGSTDATMRAQQQNDGER